MCYAAHRYWKLPRSVWGNIEVVVVVMSKIGDEL